MCLGWRRYDILTLVGQRFQYRCQVIASINICLMVFGGGKLLVDLLNATAERPVELWVGADDWISLAPLLIFACAPPKV